MKKNVSCIEGFRTIRNPRIITYNVFSITTSCFADEYETQTVSQVHTVND